MKIRFLLLVLLSVVFGCQKKSETTKENQQLTPEQQRIADGKALFESNNTACASCHQPDKKVIGPSIKEIASIYKKNNASITHFLQEKAKPIVEPEQYSVMQTNFAVIRTLTENEIKSLEAYMMSF